VLKRPRGWTNTPPQKYSSVGEAKVGDIRDSYRMYDGAPDTRVEYVMYVLGCGQKGDLLLVQNDENWRSCASTIGYHELSVRRAHFVKIAVIRGREVHTTLTCGKSEEEGNIYLASS
jgi:hypothetical protein